MSGLAAWIWGTSQLDDAVDKATSELLPSGGEDIALNLEICDQIRSKSVPAKDAVRALKRRLNHKNPNVQLLALSLTDICIKNGGDLFLAEVASRDFMDNLVSILKVPALNHDVKNNILRYIQNWAIAFEGKYQLSYVGQVYKTLQNEGYKFPPKDLAAVNSAMVDTQTAPEWIDSEVCLRCRTAFTFTNRKHHCRNCGQVFDQACSSKNMALPHFGITQEVRVCDGCYNKLTKKAEKAELDRKNSIASATKPHRRSHRSAQELDDAELQRAIRLSLQESNAASGRPGYVPSQPAPSNWAYSEPPIVDHSTRPSAIAEEEDDPDLRAAIEASLRDANAPKPSAPIPETPRLEDAPYTYPTYNQPQSLSTPPAPSSLPKLPNYDLAPLEADAIMTFNQTVEQLQAQGGKDISRYPAMNDLYEKASSLRPKLALSLDDAGRKEEMLSEMHDKLSEAVKLYDQILTRQINQPRWRASTSPSAYQPQQPQWAPQAPSQPQYQPASQPYASTPAPPQETQYYQQYQQPQQHQTQYASPQVPVSIPQFQYGYNNPQATPTSSTVQSTPNLTASVLPQSPPPAPAHVPAPSPALARHNTVSYATAPLASPQLGRSNTVSVPPPPQQYHSYAQQQQHQHHHHQQQQQQQQQQQRYHAVAPPAPVHAPASMTLLQQLPSPPTAVPQPGYSIYSASPGFEQKEERKEALLIDL